MVCVVSLMEKMFHPTRALPSSARFLTNTPSHLIDAMTVIVKPSSQILMNRRMNCV